MVKSPQGKVGNGYRPGIVVDGAGVADPTQSPEIRARLLRDADIVAVGDVNPSDGYPTTQSVTIIINLSAAIESLCRVSSVSLSS